LLFLLFLRAIPEQFEKERYIDSVNEFNSIIREFQKLYDKTPAVDRFTRVKIINGIEQSKRDLAKTQAKYEMFKYKTRTAISK
jgi:hypothetical protein